MVAIQTPLQTTLIHEHRLFAHEDADRVSHWVIRDNQARRVVIDLKRAEEATTSAFARLVLLRRSLLRDGRDLQLVNLRQNAKALYDISRLRAVLPSGERV
jgi:ABC-type transporter Mla MlaB component